MDRVFVIDDEALIGRSVQRALSRTYDVTVTDSGARAIEILGGDATFGCILCDLHMPEVSGMNVFEWVEAHAPQLASRFVFMTGGVFSDHSREFLERVRCERIEKPFDMAGLRAVVEQVCTSSRGG